MDNTFLRLDAVKTATGLSRSTIWRLEREGKFPRCVRIGVRSVGWVASEVQDWIENRIAQSRGANAGGAA
jgi:prophage regulatory protein